MCLVRVRLCWAWVVVLVAGVSGWRSLLVIGLLVVILFVGVVVVRRRRRRRHHRLRVGVGEWVGGLVLRFCRGLCVFVARVVMVVVWGWGGVVGFGW